jgi:hypothetical protein
MSEELTTCSSVCREKLALIRIDNMIPGISGKRDLLRGSQTPATGLNPEPVESSSRPSFQVIFDIHFIIILLASQIYSK